MSSVIQVENLSKQYRLGLVGSGTFKEDTRKWWAKMRGKENPYASEGEENNRSVKGGSDYVWSLKDINFELQQGDVLGIVGRNGAGKSTLLKILSKITAPTLGSVKARGRIASLLEVGTGFHPELTGRENIFLNGAILGMRKHEIKTKLDEIIAFAGVERYIDTPVKRYSSGMYVRLAFAVAAHLENEILIIDEVLAVGDAEFQKKCLGKMGEVSKGEGRTVLFVSHNMSAIKTLCNKSIVLKNGTLFEEGPTNQVINNYLNNSITTINLNRQLTDSKTRRGNGEVRFLNVIINDNKPKLRPDNEIFIKINLEIIKDINDLYFFLGVKNSDSTEYITSTNLIKFNVNYTINNQYQISIFIKPNILRTGLYPLYIWCGRKGQLAEDDYPYDLLDSIFYLNITSSYDVNKLGYDPESPFGFFNLDFESSIITI
jgi:lipopolysaccharide transport system ATP-binding protein